MKIIFESTVLVEDYHKKDSNRSGIFQCVRNILAALSSHGNDLDIRMFSSGYFCLEIREYIKAERLEKLSVEPISILQRFLSYVSRYENRMRREKKRILRLLVNLFKHIVMLFDIKRKPECADVALFPMSLRGLKNIEASRIFIVLYDMMPVLFKENYPGLPWHQELLEFMSANADNEKVHYFAISENTKKDFLKYIPKLKPESISVMPLAANEKYYQEKSVEKINSVKNKYAIPENKKYVLSLCSLEPRKNIIMACKSFCAFTKKNKIDDLVFVLAGGHWDTFLPVLNKEIDRMEKDRILQVGYVDDEDVAALYSGAEWFVYTSQYEGFGLPPLEAMQCGCPVVVSNNSSLPEVVGDAGIMIDCNSEEQHVKAFEDYYFNKALRKANSEKGIERAGHFSWKKTADIIKEEIFKEQIR